MYVSPLVVNSPPFNITWVQSRMCHCTRFFFLAGGGGGDGVVGIIIPDGKPK